MIEQAVIRAPSDVIAGDRLDACANCGARLTGAYCQECGQKRFSRHDLTVRHFVGHALHELTHFESTTTIRTLSRLVFKPGFLTNAYLEGRREGYIEPVRLYLSISALFFLFAWGVMLQNGADVRIEHGLEKLAQYRPIDVHAAAERFSHYLKTSEAAARFGSALALALFLKLLYRRSKRYYIEHLIVALHYISFSFLFVCAIELVRVGLRAVHLRMPVVPGLQLPVQFADMFLALRTVYAESRAMTFLKAFVLALGELGLFIASVAVAAAGAIIALLLT